MAQNLRVAELDFDQIKTNLKEFLRAKPEFTDYDFEGAGLSVLMDLLAYNTHYNAVIGNMLVQEMYLDTAVRKQSLALISKRLGYLPKSYRAPKAVVSLEVFPGDSPLTLTLGKGARFTTVLNSTTTATFTTREAATIQADINGRYIFNNVSIYEGSLNTFKYVYDSQIDNKFEIPSEFVDTSMLRVYVQDNISSSNVVEWTNYNSIVDLDSTNKAYFVKMNENQRYEVYFGDDVISKNLVTGNVVILDYLITNGPVANGAAAFTFSDTVGGYSNTLTTTITSAYGGDYPESNDSIKVNAQNMTLAQNRAVTEKDYETIISTIVPIETISVKGGETMNPPVYGKVFISIKQLGTTTPLSDTQKADISALLKKRAIMGIPHEFIDPQYIYITVDTLVKYDPAKTTLDANTLKTRVFDGIKQYGIDTMNTFNATFEYSKLVAYIDDIDSSIISNDTKIKLTKENSFVYGASYQYMFNFGTAIEASNSKETNISSNAFRIESDPDKDLYIKDVDGVLSAFYYLNNQPIVLVENMGTVNYTTGMVVITCAMTTGTSTNFAITTIPVTKTILPNKDNILTLRDSNILINLTIQ